MARHEAHTVGSSNLESLTARNQRRGDPPASILSSTQPTTFYGAGLLSDCVQGASGGPGTVTMFPPPLLYDMFWRIRLGH